MSRSKPLQYKSNDIFKLTDNGLDVFKREIGNFSSNKNIKSPLRSGDDNPSFRIKQSKTSGLWIATDHGGEQWHGNAIQFIEKLYNLTFEEAIEKITNDLNLRQSRVYTKKIIQEAPSKIFTNDVIIDVDIQMFHPIHHKYWNAYYLDEEFLNTECDIYAVRSWAINKKKVLPTRNEATFVYIYKDINGNETGKFKILRIGPEITKKEKWKNNVGPLEIWYLYKYFNNSNCNQLFFAKANKDSAVFMKSGLCSVTGNSENYAILTQLIPKLKELFPGIDIISVMGTDKQGKETSIALTKEHDLKWFNTPNNVLDYGINDPAEYQKGFGVKAFQLLLKNKNFL